MSTSLRRYLPWPVTDSCHKKGRGALRRIAARTPPVGKCAPRKPLRCLVPPHMPFDPVATAELLTRSMAGYDPLFVGDSGGCVRLEQENTRILTYVPRNHTGRSPVAVCYSSVCGWDPGKKALDEEISGHRGLGFPGERRRTTRRLCVERRRERLLVLSSSAVCLGTRAWPPAVAWMRALRPGRDEEEEATAARTSQCYPNPESRDAIQETDCGGAPRR